MPEHNEAHGGDRELAPASLLGEDGIQEGRIGCVKHRPMTPVDAELERLVPLEHEDGLGVEPGCEHRRYLAPAAPEPLLEPLDIHLTASCGPGGQPEEQLAVHLGEPRQFEPTEQIVGVVDGAVVGADDVPGPDRVVVAVDPLIPAGSPARVAEQNRCTVDACGGREQPRFGGLCGT